MCPLYPSSSSSSSWGIYRFIDGPGTKEEPDPLEGHWWQMRTCATQKPTLLSLPFLKTWLYFSLRLYSTHWNAFPCILFNLVSSHWRRDKKINKKGTTSSSSEENLRPPFVRLRSSLVWYLGSHLHSLDTAGQNSTPRVCVCVCVTHKKRVKPMG